MPLEPVAVPASVELSGVTFAMKNGESFVSVFVTAEALQSCSSGDLAEAFQHCRTAVEWVASDVFDASGGNVSQPIRVTSRLLNLKLRQDPVAAIAKHGVQAMVAEFGTGESR